MKKSDDKPVVAGIGELLWDILPAGKQLGGAPFNFAYHASQAGCEGIVISAVGKDELGKEIIKQVQKLGLTSQFIQFNLYPTGVVSIKLDENGNPQYTIHENVAWDHLHWDKSLAKIVTKLDAVCFGSLIQRNWDAKKTILKFLKNVNSGCLKVFDINLRQHYFSREIVVESLQLSDILKLNEDELQVISDYLNLKGNVEFQLKYIFREFNLKYLAYTMGSEGSILLSANEESFMKVPKIKVVDTVGAGDSFTAMMVAGILYKKNIRTIHKCATDVAAYVCKQHGATPKIPIELLKSIVK